jgi:site-specific DNA-methyltransferase (adenine-specific)/adenine-specific DNA-methyltransferase
MTDKQGTLGLDMPAGAVESVENYQFEPIKGYPMLNWRGKRPFTSTQFYPAQLKEIHGEEVDGWRNKVFWGDNLQVMSHLLKEYRGKVDLIYIDPPFDSKADYKKKIQVKGKSAENDSGAFEEKQYSDIWSNDEYLQFMYERFCLLKELLSGNGSIFIHCDHRKSHHLRCILDEIFGDGNFRSVITREKCNTKNYTSNSFGNISDVILFYSKTNEYKWETLYDQMSNAEIELSFAKIDEKGRRYKTAPLHAAEERSGETGESWRGIMPPVGGHWRYVHKTLDELDANGLIEWSSTGNPRKIVYADKSKGIPLQDIWLKVKDNGGDYPTQKNEILLQRIIESASENGDLVFDCFMGSGTTQAVAMKLGRRFIGADINLGAVQTTTKRLIKVADGLRQQSLDPAEKRYTGFEVYNVNHYDIFRNPVQAKDLLIEALEIQPLAQGAVFDGEKDGFMVKIMPVNRIATRADLNELIAGFNYKAWDERQNKNPNQVVEKVMLVCMGHEADLKAQLILASKPYKIDVEVVDILRDKSNLEFKRDSDARLAVKAGTLVIERFYPMNLLQKLSLQKEAVEDWRELVESILIDWNYDGSVLQPTVLDIPGKEALVQGSYPIPADASTIRVKITDLLSESWEGEISNG